MEHVISTDGTPIAVRQDGTGPPLVLVHGAASDHSRWGLLVEHLEDTFTTYVIDRRGRGESGDADDYSITLESQDIATVANSIDGPVSVYGHSSGALYSLEAAPNITNLRRLVLYEPVIPEGSSFFPPHVVEQLEKLVDAGNREEAVITFMRDVAKFPDHEIEKYRTLPSWPARVAAAHTFPSEMSGINDYRFNPSRFADLTVPVLLLQGEESSPMFKNSIELLHGTLPNSRIHNLQGQGHAADNLAPEMVASALIQFLKEDANYPNRDDALLCR